MLGIIGAMDEEVAKIKEHMTDVEVHSKASMDFYKGFLNGKEAVVVRSGIGKVNAGICTQILVDDYEVDAVINTGIAGSLNKDIDIGDIVLSTDTLWMPFLSVIGWVRSQEWTRFLLRQMSIFGKLPKNPVTRFFPV